MAFEEEVTVNTIIYEMGFLCWHKEIADWLHHKQDIILLSAALMLECLQSYIRFDNINTKMCMHADIE